MCSNYICRRLIFNCSTNLSDNTLPLIQFLKNIIRMTLVILKVINFCYSQYVYFQGNENTTVVLKYEFCMNNIKCLEHLHLHFILHISPSSYAVLKNLAPSIKITEYAKLDVSLTLHYRCCLTAIRAQPDSPCGQCRRRTSTPPSPPK